jgi:hypothetical protein
MEMTETFGVRLAIAQIPRIEILTIAPGDAFDRTREI